MLCIPPKKISICQLISRNGLKVLSSLYGLIVDIHKLD